MVSPDAVKNGFDNTRLSRQAGLETGVAAMRAIRDRHAFVNRHSLVTALATIDRILAGYVSSFGTHLFHP